MVGRIFENKGQMKYIGQVTDKSYLEAKHPNKRCLAYTPKDTDKRIYADEMPMADMRGTWLWALDNSLIDWQNGQRLKRWRDKMMQIVPLDSWMKALRKQVTKEMLADELYVN